MSVVVVIPVYGNPDLLKVEEIRAIQQITNVLADYEITVVAPAGYDSGSFMQVCSIQRKISWVFFDPYYFQSVYTYSYLLLNRKFYRQFKKFTYILIAQPDSWVFRNELDLWCKKGYDYIGAPWFEGWNHGTGNFKITGVGNGGFSLRNCRKALQILWRIAVLRKAGRLWKRTGIEKIKSFDWLLKKCKNIFHISDTQMAAELLQPHTHFEDYYWAYMVARSFDDYQVAPVKDAMQFSFEVNAAYLFEQTGNKLPFGCHGWEKYDSSFWHQYINVN